MKNRTLVTALRQFNPGFLVLITAKLKRGCIEKGFGTGRYEGFLYSQEYTVSWNEGHLCSTEDDGYNVARVIKILLEKPLSKISQLEFDLKPGELGDGNTDYETTWEDEKPTEVPGDDILYRKMEFGEIEYEWIDAKYIEFEVLWVNNEGVEETEFFSLTQDEEDDQPDPVNEAKNKGQNGSSEQKKANRNDSPTFHIDEVAKSLEMSIFHQILFVLLFVGWKTQGHTEKEMEEVTSTVGGWFEEEEEDGLKILLETKEVLQRCKEVFSTYELLNIAEECCYNIHDLYEKLVKNGVRVKGGKDVARYLHSQINKAIGDENTNEFIDGIPLLEYLNKFPSKIKGGRDL
jgi:hypothetical protein